MRQIAFEQKYQINNQLQAMLLASRPKAHYQTNVGKMQFFQTHYPHIHSGAIGIPAPCLFYLSSAASATQLEGFPGRGFAGGQGAAAMEIMAGGGANAC